MATNAFGSWKPEWTISQVPFTMAEPGPAVAVRLAPNASENRSLHLYAGNGKGALGSGPAMWPTAF
ncbi:hypothetical protein ACFYWU_41865 [Streptomyces chrestomyceticus]|uniref:hypothetical protein n=1 Tax=Streptomyces chrestomyceticus TaxID=68185 RepID=UPI0036B074BE